MRRKTFANISTSLLDTMLRPLSTRRPPAECPPDVLGGGGRARVRRVLRLARRARTRRRDSRTLPRAAGESERRANGRLRAQTRTWGEGRSKERVHARPVRPGGP